MQWLDQQRPGNVPLPWPIEIVTRSCLTGGGCGRRGPRPRIFVSTVPVDDPNSLARTLRAGANHHHHHPCPKDTVVVQTSNGARHSGR